jgi:hypothetical protein
MQCLQFPLCQCQNVRIILKIFIDEGVVKKSLELCLDCDER